MGRKVLQKVGGEDKQPTQRAEVSSAQKHDWSLRGGGVRLELNAEASMTPVKRAGNQGP